MKFNELKNKSLNELNNKLLTLKKEQFNLRFQKSTGQLENSSRIRKIRRDIAKVQTIQSQQLNNAFK